LVAFFAYIGASIWQIHGHTSLLVLTSVIACNMVWHGNAIVLSISTYGDAL